MKTARKHYFELDTAFTDALTDTIQETQRGRFSAWGTVCMLYHPDRWLSVEAVHRGLMKAGCTVQWEHAEEGCITRLKQSLPLYRVVVIDLDGFSMMEQTNLLHALRVHLDLAATPIVGMTDKVLCDDRYTRMGMTAVWEQISPRWVLVKLIKMMRKGPRVSEARSVTPLWSDSDGVLETWSREIQDVEQACAKGNLYALACMLERLASSTMSNHIRHFHVMMKKYKSILCLGDYSAIEQYVETVVNEVRQIIDEYAEFELEPVAFSKKGVSR